MGMTLPERLGRIEYRGHGGQPRNSAELKMAQHVAGVAFPSDGHWAYEPLRFKVGVGCWYTPDFVLICSREVTVYEVKGRYRVRRDGVVRLRAAAWRYVLVTLSCGDVLPVVWKLIEQCGADHVEIITIKEDNENE